ncbi:hypothetical protein ACFWUQ_09005 [Streptomyces sp. NPDC058662]|uniref:hypothetical protein n=1 Tax=Streptomyces sp. NPDC058662 TaxID=3346583 RepID=UPI0036675056
MSTTRSQPSAAPFQAFDDSLNTEAAAVRPARTGPSSVLCATCSIVRPASSLPIAFQREI